MGEAKGGGKQTVAQFVVARLREWGVRRIYGYPGDGINGVLGALRETEGAVQLVQVAHEEVAALAATGHAKYTGELGVCLSTAGPGAVHLLNGLYDARLDHQPVLAIVGQQDAAAMGSAFQQEIDLVSLFKDVAGAYVQQVASPDQVRHVVDQAIRTALARRAPTCIILPHDVQGQDAVPEPAHEHGRMHSSVGFAAPRMLPADAELDAAAEVLNAGKKVAVLVGAGALQAGDAVAEVAERLGAGVAKALLARRRSRTTCRS
jgi:pyruvate dehydrogenase (quinone)